MKRANNESSPSNSQELTKRYKIGSPSRSSNKLTAAQQDALSAILDDEVRFIHLDGGAGSGKSYVIHEAVKFIKNNEFVILGPTGISAENINGIINCIFKNRLLLSEYCRKK